MGNGNCKSGDRKQVDRLDSRRWTGLVFATTAVVVALGSLNSNLHANGMTGHELGAAQGAMTSL